MAKNRNTDFASFLRSQGLRKRLAKAVSDLEGSDLRGNAEKLARRVIGDLRSAADEIEKRLNVSTGAGKRRAPAKRGRKSTARKSTARKSTARKSTARKSTARKSTTRKAPAKRTTSARKSTARKSTARKSTGRKTTRRSPRKSS